MPNKSLIKLIYIKRTNIHQQLHIEQKLPLIFVYHQRSILIPDFNICILLKIINPNIDIDIIHDYVRNINFHYINTQRI